MTKVEGEHPGPLPCTRYAEGAQRERQLIVEWIRAIPPAHIDDWGLNASDEIAGHIETGNAAKGAAWWNASAYASQSSGDTGEPK